MTAPPSLGSGQPDLPPQPAFRELSRTFWRGVSSTSGLGAALEEVLAEFNSHIGSRRTSVWLHHRRARELYLFASSDAGHRLSGDRTSASDSSHAAARGLRLDQPLVFQAAPEAVGTTEALERWVELSQGKEVKGREVVSIVPQAEIKMVVKDTPPASGASKVQLLKGNDYLRVWINKGGNHYLIHFPVAAAAASGAPATK